MAGFLIYLSSMEKIAYQGKIIEVVEKTVDVQGKEKIFEIARRSPGVRLIIPKDDLVILSKEFRHELGTFDYRLPGGKVFDTLEEYNQANKSPESLLSVAEHAAKKEAHEEVGIDVTDIKFFHKSICGATVEWDLYYFIVESFETGEQHLEEGETISVELVHKDEARAMCLDGRISEERSALALLRYLSQ